MSMRKNREPTSVFEALQHAVAAAATEAAETKAVGVVLGSYGFPGFLPKSYETKAADGRKVRIYVWHGTPAGDIALITGPDVEGNLVHAADVDLAKADAGVYLKAAPLNAKMEASVTKRLTKPAEKALAHFQRDQGFEAPAPKPARSRKKPAVIVAEEEIEEVVPSAPEPMYGVPGAQRSRPSVGRARPGAKRVGQVDGDWDYPGAPDPYYREPVGPAEHRTLPSGAEYATSFGTPLDRELPPQSRGGPSQEEKDAAAMARMQAMLAGLVKKKRK